MTQIDIPPQERAPDPAGCLWNEPRVRRLVGLWQARLSAARIAAQLGPGVTRNAVVGKLMRLGLKRSEEQRQDAQLHGARSSRRVRADWNRREPPALPARPLPEPTPCAAVPRLVPLTALTRSCCRWPYELEDDTRFCGLKATGGRPYCPDHQAIAYVGVLAPLTPEALGL